MIVIGAGTGRCGTKSLSILLDNCKDSAVTHESPPILPWSVSERFESRLETMQESDHAIVGDVASSYLPYMEEYDGFKKIVLKRDKQETVDSFMRHSGPRNNWQERGYTDPKWFDFFPTYSDDLTKKEALEQYWEDYYERAEEVAKVFPLETLNSEEGQDNIFNYLKIPKELRNYTLPCKYNKGRH